MLVFCHVCSVLASHIPVFYAFGQEATNNVNRPLFTPLQHTILSPSAVQEGLQRQLPSLLGCAKLLHPPATVLVRDFLKQVRERGNLCGRDGVRLLHQFTGVGQLPLVQVRA